ncbi:EAL domain-containing protein (plasmid) [Pseudoalteromonas mariniglutinosa]
MGFIWIGTMQGLNRFDGYQVKPFSGEHILEQRSINTLYKTRNGKIFVSTDFSGAYFIDPVSLKVEKIYSGKLDAESKRYSPIFAVEEDELFFYFAIDEHVYSYNKKNHQFLHEFSINKSDDIVRALTVHNNFLYIGTSNGLFSKNLQDEHISRIPLTSKEARTAENHNIKFLKIDPQLGLLIGTVEGMFTIAFDQQNLLSFEDIKLLIPRFNIWGYSKTSFGEFFVTEHGLYQFDRHSNQATFILRFDQSKFSMTDNTILDVMVDKTGVMWLASRSQGVFTWSTLARRFEHIALKGPTTNHNDMIWSIYEDPHHPVLWFGTDNGLVKYDRTTKLSDAFLTSQNKKAFYGESAVYGISQAALDEEKRYLWLLLYHGLALFDKRTTELVPLPASDDALTLLKDTPSYGFQEVSPDVFAFFNYDNYYIYSAKEASVRIIKGLKEQLDPANGHAFLKPLPSHPNELVFSASGRLYRYNENSEKLTLIYQAENYNPLAYMTIDAWELDYNNVLWLASSQEGLIGIDAQSYEVKHRISLKNGLKTKSINALQIDMFGFLWFSSQNGLYRLDLNSLNVDRYFVKDGLSVNEFNLAADTQLENGKLVFGTTRGALLFSPQDFLSMPVKIDTIKTEITNVSLLSRELNYHPYKYQTQPLTLSADDIGLEISFSNFDYQNIDKTAYQVTLKGPSALQYDNFSSNKVFFTKLPAGKYQLSVASYIDYGNRVASPRTLDFEVAYAPWQSPLAKVSYIAIIIAILVLIFWQYRARQRAISHAHKQIIKSQQQTDLALSSNNSGVWEVNVAEQTILTNRCQLELGYKDYNEYMQMNDFIALVHPDDKRMLLHNWESFVHYNSSQQWNTTYRLKHSNGLWLWYQDIGRIIERDEHNKPLRISGIYTNITEQRANAQQASVLGEAFSQINDWLVILDSQLQLFSVNTSFKEAFSIPNNMAELTLKRVIAAIGKQQYREYISVLKSLKPKQNWKTEAYIRTQKNAAHPVHISVTAVAKDAHIINYYVIVISDLTEQKRAEDELRYLANYDPLTGLPNRNLMLNKINDCIKSVKDNNKLAALLFIDLDKFKPVNDSFGHAIGDQLLCNITQRVNHLLPDNAIMGRQSGDEFLVLVKDLNSPQLLSELVKELTVELANKVVIDDFSINISASIGVALYPFDAHKADELIRNADIAMMHAKQSGRNNFKYFTEQMNNQLTQKLLLENALKDAFKEDELFNNYQPIVNAKTKKINGVELLMRWKTDSGFVSPAEFIPIAEEIGLIDVLTEQALDRALTELNPLLRANPQFYLSLNLSPAHILKSNLTERLLLILNNHLIKPVQLRLEITENTLLEDKEKAAKQLQKLKNAGFKLLLDDFGTGYSSLTYLSQFPIDVIKIDQSFVKNIGLDKSNESIIKTIHALATNLDLYCIAEGVETTEQIRFLNHIGCHDLQGFYFAKPMLADTLLSQTNIAAIISRLQAF